MVTPDQIRERMEVVGNDGLHVGVIDRVEAGEIRLTRNDTPDGLHHFLPLANFEYVDDRVHLNRSSIRAMANGVDGSPPRHVGDRLACAAPCQKTVFAMPSSCYQKRC
jgi:hypothetical protein